MTGDHHFFLLQKEKRSIDAAFLSGLKNVTDLQSHLVDFSETAAVIANLDLVITVDTSVAHLAGALGKPVWIMLPFSPDFRWLLERTDSPWYPTARLFRQPEIGDWDSVAKDVKRALDLEFAA
jgi:ADP-heptose:LPS heptosyltransferase